MNRMTAGNVYTAARTFTGTNQRGKYELVVTQDERGKDDITLFVAENCIPSGITNGDKFRLNKIVEVSHGWKQGQKWNPEKKCKEDGWVEVWNINAEVKRIGSDLDDMGSELENLADEPLPWEELSL